MRKDERSNKIGKSRPYVGDKMKGAMRETMQIDERDIVDSNCS